jgi:hypothetical protein
VQDLGGHGRVKIPGRVLPYTGKTQTARKSRTGTRTEVSNNKQHRENQENERQTGLSKTKAMAQNQNLETG